MKETQPYRSYLASQLRESQPKEWSLGLPACASFCSGPGSSDAPAPWGHFLEAALSAVRYPLGLPQHVETSLELLEHLLCTVMICVKTGIAVLIFLFPSV